MENAHRGLDPDQDHHRHDAQAEADPDHRIANRQATSSIRPAPPNSSTPAKTKSSPVQLTSSVNCMATAGVSMTRAIAPQPIIRSVCQSLSRSSFVTFISPLPSFIDAATLTGFPVTGMSER